MAALISGQGLWKSHGERQLLRGATLTIEEGERVALVGANGSGKSSLLRILAGIELPDAGLVVRRRGLNLGFLEQDPPLEPTLSARDAVRSGMTERATVLRELELVAHDMSSAPAERMVRLLVRQAALEERLERLGGHDVEHRIEALLLDFGLENPAAACSTLSGGERRRVALARIFLSAPDLLLLDEPTNHLDTFVTELLEDRLVASKIPCLLVTHDRYFLDRAVERIVELEQGELVPYDGGYGDYLVQKAERLATEARAESSRLILLRRETKWMRRGAPARTTKAKARIGRFQALVDDAPEERGADLAFTIPPGPRLGDRVIDMKRASAVLGTRAVISPLDLSIGRCERIGIVGRNGAGKTTLLRLATAQLAPTSGSVQVGETVKVAWIDQQRATLDPTKTIIGEIAGESGHVAVGDRAVRAEAFLDGFLFPGAMKHRPIATLSGGERNRVMLAKMLVLGGNLLVLDEPTNDLDLPSLRALEEALIAFEGTVLVVSHDRWFLDRVATRILHVDGRGNVRAHPGDVSSLLAQIGAETEAARAPALQKTSGTVAPATERTRKKNLSSWHQRELDALPDAIAAAESGVAAFDARLADPKLYAGAKSDAERVRSERAELATRVAEMWARWQELEEMRGG